MFPSKKLLGFFSSCRISWTFKTRFGEGYVPSKLSIKRHFFSEVKEEKMPMIPGWRSDQILCERHSLGISKSDLLISSHPICGLLFSNQTWQYSAVFIACSVNPGLINPGWLIVVVPPNSDFYGYWVMVHPQLNSRLGFINPGLTFDDFRSYQPPFFCSGISNRD